CTRNCSAHRKNRESATVCCHRPQRLLEHKLLQRQAALIRNKQLGPLQNKIRFPEGGTSPMKLYAGYVVVGFLSLVLSPVQPTLAQTPIETTSALPRLVRFGGVVKDVKGNPL